MIKKILLEMASNLFAGLEHGEHIDESKHLYFEHLIAHAPIEDFFIPPREVKHRRRFSLQAGKNLPANDLGLLFDLVG